MIYFIGIYIHIHTHTGARARTHDSYCTCSLNFLIYIAYTRTFNRSVEKDQRSNCILQFVRGIVSFGLYPLCSEIARLFEAY